MAIDLSTPTACVTQGSRVFTKAEKLLDEVHGIVGKLDPVFVAANESHAMMGSLKTLHLRAAAKAVQGKIAEALDALALLHREATDIAIENGVDQVSGADGEVVILGGGGR